MYTGTSLPGLEFSCLIVGFRPTKGYQKMFSIYMNSWHTENTLTVQENNYESNTINKLVKSINRHF